MFFYSIDIFFNLFTIVMAPL